MLPFTKQVQLACDFATPDLVYHLRKPGFNWPVHRALLSRGILICEHLTGHAALALPAAPVDRFGLFSSVSINGVPFYRCECSFPLLTAECDWAVHRQDDNGNRFVVQTGLSREEAERLAAELEARVQRTEKNG